MKRVIVALAVLFCLCSVLCAEVPRHIHFQGFLTDNGDSPLSGAYTVVFRIYDSETGGVPLWEESHNSVAVTNGYYDVTLGTLTALGLPFDTQYYLALEVNSDGEMAPRYRMCAAPYAIRAAGAEDAEKLNGEHPSYYLDYNNLSNVPSTFPPESHQHTGNDITSAVAEANNSDTVDGFHASSAPAPGNLLPLDASGMFPSSVIPPVSDADKLDGQDGSYYLDWNNLANKPAKYPDADKLDGQDSPYYLDWNNLANVPLTFPPGAHQHDAGDITSGTLSLARIPQGTGSGLDADKIDGKESSGFASASHTHSAGDIDSGTLATDRYSAYSDLSTESKIGTGSTQLAAGNHTHSTLPIAFASISSSGIVNSGTSNVSCTWNDTDNRYEITISGETYSIADYVTLVTPAFGPYTFRASASGGKLLVYFYNSSGSLVKSTFYFATFKP